MNGYKPIGLFLSVSLLICLPIGLAFAQPYEGMHLLYGEQSGGAFQDIAFAEDGTIYVAGGIPGVLVLSQSGQDSFEVVCQVEVNQDHMFKCEAFEDRLLVTGQHTLALYDISNTTDPVLLNRYDIDRIELAYGALQNSCWGHGDYVYLQDDSFKVIQLHENGTLSLVYEYSQGEMGYGDLQFYDGLLYRAILNVSWEYNVIAMDCTDPAHPLGIANLMYDIPSMEFHIYNDYLVSIGMFDLVVYDISQHEYIALVDRYMIHNISTLENARMFGNYIYVDDWSADMTYAFEFSDNETQAPVDTLARDQRHNSLNSVVRNQYVFTPAGEDGLHITEVGDEPFGAIQEFNPINAWRNFFLVDDLVLIENENFGFKSYRLYESGEMVLLGHLYDDTVAYLNRCGMNSALLSEEPYGGYGDLDDVIWNKVLVPDETEPLGFSLSNDFFTEDTYFSNGFSEWIYAIRTCRYSDTLLVFDATDAMNPALDTSFVLPFEAYGDAGVSQNYLYVFCENEEHEDGVAIYSLDNPGIPELIHHVPMQITSSEIQVFDEAIILNNSNSIPDIYLLEDPENPELMTIQELEVLHSVIDFKNDYLMMRESYREYIFWDRVVVYDCRNGFDYPEPVASIIVPGSADTHAKLIGDNRILMTWHTGYGVFELGEVSVDDAHCRSIPTSLQMQAYPNPANPETRITLELPQTEAVKVCVYDVLGREVARLHEGVLHAGSHAFHFGSQPGLASGVYFVQAIAGKWETTQRIVLLK